MTTLKSINKAIEEGNEDLEKLNTTFTKWFELQKKNRLDDLENAREMKRATKVSATSGAGAATGSKEKGGIGFPKLLAGLAAAIAALTAARAVFGDPGTDRPISKNKLLTPKSRTVRTGAVARANARLVKIQLANTKAQLLAEQNKAKALAAEARKRFLERRIKAFPGALAEPATQQKANLAQQRAQARARAANKLLLEQAARRRALQIKAFPGALSSADEIKRQQQNRKSKLDFRNNRLAKTFPGALAEPATIAKNNLAQERAQARARAANKLAMEQAARRRALQIKAFPGALAEPATIAKNNLAQQRAQIKADAARFRANSNKPTTNFKPFTPGYKPQIMFPNAQQAKVQGNLTRMSRPATVTSSTGRVYPVNSPEGRRVIKMTQTYQDSVRNMRGNGQMNAKNSKPEGKSTGASCKQYYTNKNWR